MAGASDKAIISEAAGRYGIPANILWGLYGTETGFGSNVKASSAGAVGPFQFEPSTARGMGINPYNFKEAAFGAAKYLSQYKGRGIGGMLSAYNAGPAGGYQSGYVNSTLQNAKSFGSAPGKAAQNPAGSTGQYANIPGMRIPGTRTLTAGSEGVAPKNVLEFNQAGYQKAKSSAEFNKLLGNLPGGKELRGIFSSKMPQIGEYLGNKTIPGKPGMPNRETTTPGYTLPGTRGALGGPGTSGKVPAGHELHGLLPVGAKVLEWNRKDQGRDVQLTPGQLLLATGDGYVIRNGSDPSGFGPSYPIIHLTSGPEAGKDVYYGHTDSLVKPGQRLKAGDPVARTSKTGHNAKPGWLEYGFAPGGTPGPFGQPSPF